MFGTGFSSAGKAGKLFFLLPPKEKVLPALFKNPLEAFAGGGGGLASFNGGSGFLVEPLKSSWAA